MIPAKGSVPLRPSWRWRLRIIPHALSEGTAFLVWEAFLWGSAGVLMFFVCTILCPPRLISSRIDSTRTDAQSIRSAVQMYKVEHRECPASVDELAGDYLDSSRRMLDAWNHDFRIECEGNDIFVVSAGPDGLFGTEDDIE